MSVAPVDATDMLLKLLSTDCPRSTALSSDSEILDPVIAALPRGINCPSTLIENPEMSKGVIASCSLKFRIISRPEELTVALLSAGAMVSIE